MKKRGSKKIFVEKMNGDKEPYDSNKLIKSLKKVGANKEVIEPILKKVEEILYDGIKTEKLFDFVHEELDKTRPGSGLRYDLKKAMTKMRIQGGFVFEKFVGMVLKAQGYEIEMNPIIQGKNVPHEIDVFARKKEEKLMVEVKHHMRAWEGESIQTALYVYARFLELEDKFTQPMIVTNTKFSPQVIKYSKGVGIRLMGWKYPYKNSLEDSITKYELYPITILKISKEQIKRYLKRNIFTLQQLKEHKGISKKTKSQIDSVLGNIKK